ncbi:site-specific DNA-methyltransferase [Chryseobacterium sp. MP_3.2]|uniref:site-specific DNA-methyltransferase n=1 Tax=Chryseobacterium sp. MP_3.2 TaxID=3071712 RepID=UPI002E0A08B7|nr:adenine-specific DNA-methyltransferase [Chryseobacterium sp. MP_3.2]
MLKLIFRMPTLHWIGKDKVINHHQDVPYRILEKQYTYKDGQESDAPSENKIIHGDNLEALKSLLPEYEGKVKCIYIDPPYNTGNEGWVYNDNNNDPKLKKWLGQVVGKESEDLSRHDKWLCMMYPRLKLLHKLLAQDGAIFISIDDNEQANLRLVCDEIFGGSNFITNIIWEKNYSPRNDAKYFSASHDFISVFAKTKSLWKRNLEPRSEKQNKYYKYDDNDERGRWRPDNVLVKSFSLSGVFGIENPTTGVIHFPPKGNCYRFSENKAKELLSNNKFYFGKDGKGKPQLKRYLAEVNDGIVPQTIWKYEDVSHSQEGKTEFNSIIDGNVFDTPKPSKLIEKIIQIGTNENDIILDSFAGSGTTAHGVLNLNKEDGGNRKFILIEMEDYANSITAERVKRVINGYGEGTKAVEGTGGDFSYYELGKPVFLENEMLNEEIGREKIEEYVWFSETKLPYQSQKESYLLGTKDQTAYYFYYDPSSITTLDESFLRTLKTKASQYIIYADNCLLTKKLMQKYNIIFKKIPRDITRF